MTLYPSRSFLAKVRGIANNRVAVMTDNSQMLETIVTETGTNPVGCVIWMHGLGADATDFEPIVPLLELRQPLRFVFPNAPVRAVTINGGAKMRAWYDIDPAAPLAGGDDIAASAEAVAQLIDVQIETGLQPAQIVLAGFSQGGVIALQLGLSYPNKLRGIMALSTYLHDHEHIAERLDFANVETPIFMAHGLSDPMIPITRAITSRETLLNYNYAVQWHEYAMGHQVCPQEIADIAQWLNTLYP